MKKYLIFIVVFIGTFIFLIEGCGKKDTGKKVESAIKSQIEDKDDAEVKHKVHHFKLEGFTKNNGNQWYIEGDFAKMVGSEILLDRIHGESFNKEVTIALKAKRGIYNRETGSTTLDGNVVITTSDGGEITTKYAEWNKETEELKTDSYVNIKHSGITVQGKGAIVKPRQKWALLEKEIKAQDSTSRVITCKGPLEVDYESRKAIFNNDVEITDPDGKMYANKLIAYFNPDSRAIEKLEWIGDVKAVY